MIQSASSYTIDVLLITESSVMQIHRCNVAVLAPEL